MNTLSQMKHQQCSPPAPGSPAFEQLPAMSVLFVFFFLYPYLFHCMLRDSAGGFVTENKSSSPVFGSGSLR